MLDDGVANTGANQPRLHSGYDMMSLNAPPPTILTCDDVVHDILHPIRMSHLVLVVLGLSDCDRLASPF